MKIRFNYVVSAIVAFAFIVTTANAKNDPQNPVKNNRSSPVKLRASMADNAITTTFIKGTAAAQMVIISNVEKVTENQTDENQIFIKRYTNTNHQKAIIKPGSRKCREGFIKTSSGDCKPIFREE
ncbi:uncharacterized protein LOC132948227 [Metopolophium dirhodum]|uniref:uncharacterized protein LOC132948227 n=1 Tax=Metopolophium dirhodum TaxID=44670 RepID=UPI00298F7DFC|nr:uncharacterized protein LOC132948227 [Metopolophium dirhodum]